MPLIKAIFETRAASTNSPIKTVTFSGTPNNISLVKSKTYNVIENGPLSYPDNIFDPFILGGYSTLNDGSQLLDEYTGFITSETAIGQTITISGTSIPGFTIFFDINNYPTKIKVDGTDYTLDNHIFNYISSSPKNSFTITIVEMRFYNSPLMVDAVASYDTLEFTSRDNLLSLNYGEQLTTLDDGLDFGVTLAYGELRIFDNQNLIETMASQGLINESGYVKLYIEDNLIGTMLFTNMTYDDDTTIKIDLVSPFDIANDVYIDKKIVEPSITGYDLLKYLIGRSNYQFGFSMTETLEKYLRGVTLENFSLDNDSLFNQWNKFCEVFMLRIHQVSTGSLRISRAI